MEFLDLREPFSAWSHGIGMVLALPVTACLWHRARGDRGRRISLLVFGLTLALCLGASAAYHGVRGPAERIELFHLLDVIGIHTLIAGTATPVAWNLLRGRWRRWILGLCWGMAGAGIAVHLGIGMLPPWAATVFYLVMGWVAAGGYFQMAGDLGHRAMRPLVAGGVCYSVGAVINLLGGPTLWAGAMAAHELFHLFVLAGGACHVAFMLSVVAPARPIRSAIPRPALLRRGRTPTVRDQRPAPGM